jgi:hypothetical protein
MLLGTVGSEAGAKFYEFGVQLGALAGVALFLGSVLLYRADRSRARLVLMAGLLLFAVGWALKSLEHLDVTKISYFPGWKADRDQIFLEEDPDLEFSEDDLGDGLGSPAWWEGPAWWGQRLALFIGAGLAVVGFALDGRDVLREGPRRTGKARKRVAR